MSKEGSPEQVMASLFTGLSRNQQMALLGRLECTGADIYRAWAAKEQNVKAREALLRRRPAKKKTANCCNSCPLRNPDARSAASRCRIGTRRTSALFNARSARIAPAR
jgi:hypothetical protein